MSTPVHAVATPLNTCHVCRTCYMHRDMRVALVVMCITMCCQTSATQHITDWVNEYSLMPHPTQCRSLPCAKMHGLDRVSCHDARSGIWAIPVHATCVGGNQKSTWNIIHKIEHLRLQRMWPEEPFLASSDDPTRKHTWLKPTRLHNTHLIAMSELSIHKPTLRTHVWKSVTTVTTAP